jgi:hypothetical protein
VTRLLVALERLLNRVNQPAHRRALLEATDALAERNPHLAADLRNTYFPAA